MLVEFAEGEALAPYVVGDVVRIFSGGTAFARLVTATRPPASLVLDTSLPAGVHLGIQVARLLPGGGTAAAQAVAGTRLGVTGLTALTAMRGGGRHGRHGGGTASRHAAWCSTAPSPPSTPAWWGSASLRVAVVRPDPAVSAAGTAAAGAAVTTASGEAARFRAGQPVEVVAGATVVRRFVAAVDAGSDTVTLDTDHGIAATTALTVTLLATTPADTFAVAEPIAGAGDHVLVAVRGLSVIGAGAVLHIGAGSNQALREVTAAPAMLAELDSPLPASHSTNLGVERLTVDNASVRNTANAPLTRIRALVRRGPTVHRRRGGPRHRPGRGPRQPGRGDDRHGVGGPPQRHRAAGADQGGADHQRDGAGRHGRPGSPAPARSTRAR